MAKHFAGLCLEWLCVLMLMSTIASSLAVAEEAKDLCAGGDLSKAGIVQATGDSLQRKSWQPQGGVVQFTVQSYADPKDALFKDAALWVCFRWKTELNNASYIQVRPDRVEPNADGSAWKVTTTVPKLDLPGNAKVETAVPLVPLAEVRIISVKGNAVIGAAATTIGIPYRGVAAVLGVLTIAVALIILWFVASDRLKQEGIKKASWPLRIISTPGGYASLSQMQIVLWTLVVAASAVYVMSLSGDLIEVTNGTLVLLGIAGAAALGTKAHNASQETAAQAEAETAKSVADKAKIAAGDAAASPTVSQTEIKVRSDAAEDAIKKANEAKDRAASLIDPPEDQKPRWSDLIVTEKTVNGRVSREVDVTRFQMLLFTLIAAAFVSMNVVTTYVLPEIPTGFLTLMGISNGVYLGAKIAEG